MSEQSDAEQRPDGQPPCGVASQPGALQLPGPPRMRRGVHVSAAATMALGIPLFLLSLGVVWSLSAIPPEPWGWVILVAWLLSGAAMFWRRSEDVLVGVLGGLHRPTQDERQRLDAAWEAVAQAAGIKAANYSLWIEESEEISARATAGHTVAVTRKALETLPPEQLEAVLAHELAHHLGGHPWALQLVYWYSLPGLLLQPLLSRLVMVIGWVGTAIRRVLWSAYRVISTVVSTFAMFSGNAGFVMLFVRIFVWYAAAMVMLMAIFFMAYLVFWLFLLSLLMVTLSVAIAWFSRLGEKYADQVAAQLGYGPALIQVFQDFRNQGQDSARAELGLLDRLQASHPSLADRISALEHYLQRNQAKSELAVRSLPEQE